MNKSDSKGLIIKYAAHYRKTKKLINNPNAYVLFEYLMDDCLMKIKNGKTNLFTKASKSFIKNETGVKDVLNTYKLLEEYELITVKSSKDGNCNTYIINHKYYNNLMYCLNTLTDHDKENQFCEAFRDRDKSKLRSLGYRELELNCELASAENSAPFTITDTTDDDINNIQKTVDTFENILYEVETWIKNTRTKLCKNDMGGVQKENALLEKPCKNDMGGVEKEHTDNNIIIKKKMNYTNEMSIHIGGETKNDEENERDVLSEKEPNLITEESIDSFSSSDNIDLLPDNKQTSIEQQEEIEWKKFMDIKTSSDYNKEETKYPEQKKIEEIKEEFRLECIINKETDFSKMQDYLILLMRDFEIMRIDGYLYNDPELLKHLFPELKEDSNGMWYRAR